MLVNPVSGINQVNSQVAAAYPYSAARSAPNNSPLPEDTVTLSPAAQAMQTEQKLAAAAATQNALSPAAQALQTEQKLAAAAASENQLSSAAQALQTEQNLAATAAKLWMSALALTSD
ncbi:MAG: hypothetical protein ABSA96_14920 [Candidatus Acidiferrales bacterium]|jgi:hypothetical protein